jgi:hypothetical protein
LHPCSGPSVVGLFRGISSRVVLNQNLLGRHALIIGFGLPSCSHCGHSRNLGWSHIVQYGGRFVASHWRFDASACEGLLWRGLFELLVLCASGVGQMPAFMRLRVVPMVDFWLTRERTGCEIYMFASMLVAPFPGCCRRPR